MTKQALDSYLKNQIKTFPGKASVLLADVDTGEIHFAADPHHPVIAASIIKVPILLATLDQVKQKKLSLAQPIPVPPDQVLPDTQVFELGQSDYSLWELLYWMITVSDNTATNILLDLLGMDLINDYCANTLELPHTRVTRKMLNWTAVEAGCNNYTSAYDQYRLYCQLCHGRLFPRQLTKVALDILARQRHSDQFLRYIPRTVSVAHKTGTLDGISHDAGVFFLPHMRCYLGVFTWDGPGTERNPIQKQFVGRLARAVYNTYKVSL
ncbi:MAG: serine hydrolase [Clostridiales bacterium]|nr:serine hydrolase [Clostridiales bacterium]